MRADFFQGLKDQAHFLTRMFSVVKAAIIATLPGGQIVYWNPFAEELYGWEAEEVNGRNIVEIMVPHENVKSATDIIASVSAGETWTGEFTLRRRDGTRLTVVAADSPIFDETGHLIGIVGVSQDVTTLVRERLELEEQVRERTAELRAANKDLGQLMARLMQLRDQERRHFARELHDSTGQDLAMLIMELGTLEREVKRFNPKVAEQVSKTSELAKGISGSLRTMSSLLHPPLLDELGLASALRTYVDGFSSRSGINVDLQIPPDFGRLSHDMEITCFRIVQECLTNIHRHSRSASALITISYQGNSVLVEVRDRGTGIPRERLSELMSGVGGGVGLAGMRERIKQLGGTLQIKSDSGGTAVTALLPLRHSTNVAG
jgi:PAS domain S-box-containing protein